MTTKKLRKYSIKRQAKTSLFNRLLSFAIISIMIIISLPKMALAQMFDGAEEKVSGVSNATIKLPNTEYTESTVDLRVKVQGGEVKLNRTWINGRWYINPSWATLRFISDPLNNSVESIDRTGTIYQRNGDTDLYSFGQTHIKKIDTGWYWYDQQGNWIKYDSDGRILEYGDRNNIKVSFVLDTDHRRTAIKDNNGEIVYSFSYDNQEHLIKVTDREGRAVNYEWSGDKLVQVIDVLGDKWTYEYDANGQLTQKNEPDGGTIKIDYSLSVPAPKSAMTSDKEGGVVSQNNVVSTASANRDSQLARVGKITDKTGAVTIYNTQYNRVNKQYTISIDDPLGRKTKLVFNAQGKRLSMAINDVLQESIKRDTANKQIEIINVRGLSTSVKFDGSNKASKITRADGTSESFQYNNSYGMLTSYTNAQGISANFEYDDKGNLIKSMEAVNSPEQRVTSWQYDNYGQPITLTLGEGSKAITLHQSYDKYGNVISFIDGNGNTYQFTYNIQGQITSVKNPLDNIWKVAYNSAGYQTQSIDPLSHITTYNSDFSGRIQEIINPLGKKTSYSYQFDTNGWQIKQTNSLGQVYTYYYDLVGNPTKIVSPSGLEVKQNYDIAGRYKEKKDPAGNTFSLEYGQKDSGLDGLIVKALYPTFSESYQYNSLGLPTQISQWLDTNDSLTTSITYNALGLPSSIKRPNNSTSLIEYDAFGNETKLTNALGEEITKTWNRFNKLTSITDAKGNVYNFSYDNNGNLIKETKALSNEVQYTYDEANRLVSEKDASGTTTRYEYDQADRRIKISYMAKASTTPTQTVSYNYNEANQLEKVTQAGDTNAEFIYTLDALGRKVKETISYGISNKKITKELQYTYDTDGNLSSLIYPDNSQFTYNYEKGQLKETLLANGEKITWCSYKWQLPTQISTPSATQMTAYDALLRPLSMIVTDANNSLLIKRKYGYDKVSNIIQKDSEDGVVSYQYDFVNRLTQVTPSKLLQQKGLPIESYSYDAVGNRVGSGHQPGDWQYNDKNQLIQWGEGNNLTSLSYTTNGLLAKEANKDREIIYNYNAANRLVSVKEGDREVASYQYDPFGRRMSKNINGVATYYIYADEGIIAELDGQGNIQVAYGWQPDTMPGTGPLWQADISTTQTLSTASYNYLFRDYLGTPQLAVNSSGRQTWKGISEAFGKTQLTTANQITMNLRFPGQYLDQETGLHYNIFRHYNPAIGRYTQSDHLGYYHELAEYTYAANNPIVKFDPNGLSVQATVGVGASLGPAGLGMGLGVNIPGNPFKFQCYQFFARAEAGLGTSMAGFGVGPKAGLSWDPTGGTMEPGFGNGYDNGSSISGGPFSASKSGKPGDGNKPPSMSIGTDGGGLGAGYNVSADYVFNKVDECECK